MNIYDIEYINNNLQGTATVEATSPYKASVFLQGRGRLNATRYKAISIKHIGCNNSTVERILRETYQEKVEECNLPAEEDKEECKFDINSLSKKDIQDLKLKINEETGTIYVNRITGYSSFNRPKATDGYSYFITHTSPSYQKVGLYVKKDGKDVYLGIPFKYRHVESYYRIVDIIHGDYDPTAGYPCFEVKNKYPKKRGLFIKTRNRHSGMHWLFAFPLTRSEYSVFTNTVNRKLVKNKVIEYVKEKIQKKEWKSPPRNRVVTLEINNGNSEEFYVVRIAIGEARKRNLVRASTVKNSCTRLKGRPEVEYSFLIPCKKLS